MANKKGPGRPPKQVEEEPVAAEPQSPGRVYPQDHPLNYKDFWGPADKGAARPAFCYPQRIDKLKEEVHSMERNLEMGFVSAERKMAYEMRLQERKTRLDSILENSERVQKIINGNKDAWAKRRQELAKEISAAMPSLKDIEKRRVNPYRIAKMEKEGLGEKKKEYIVISRALGEESNISFLQRD